MSEQKSSIDACKELAKARRKSPTMRSAHERFAILKEEVDELWDEIKGADDSEQMARMRPEAVQVAAMVLQFIEDVCDAKRDK
jgi:NTP pyrophosphatase (non-canonical NTP hydrolase)